MIILADIADTKPKSLTPYCANLVDILKNGLMDSEKAVKLRSTEVTSLVIKAGGMKKSLIGLFKALAPLFIDVWLLVLSYFLILNPF